MSSVSVGRQGLPGRAAGLSYDAIIATNGAVMQMFNHGLSAAGMFFLVGVIYSRTHTRDLKEYGGIWTVMPLSLIHISEPTRPY